MKTPKKTKLPLSEPRPRGSKLKAWELKSLEFIEHYLACFNASEAARRMGYGGASAASQGWEFLHHDFTQAELQKRYRDHAEKNQQARQEIIAMLYREANYFGEGASHSARVKAQAQLSKIFGMETIQPEAAEVVRRVMLVPHFDDWGASARASQAELVRSSAIDV